VDVAAPPGPLLVSMPQTLRPPTDISEASAVRGTTPICADPHVIN
jgi:hypothetical protein